jgi:SAM-dependent methyltransferase
MNPMPRYDADFFEALNEEYRGSPIWPAGSPQRAQTRWRENGPSPERVRLSREERLQAMTPRERQWLEWEKEDSQTKLRTFAKHGIDLSGEQVIELGCANGWLTSSFVAEHGATRATGVDVKPYPGWDLFENDRVSFAVGDLSRDAIVSDGSADAVVSFVVFEHVTRPVQMLQALHRLLRTGGTAWLYFNLYRGRSASHTYREVHFPWPHLLFDDDVARDWYRTTQKRDLSFSWVNRMTIAEYLLASSEIGFEIRVVERDTRPLDVDFYLRCEERLGRYPALDLETDFVSLVLDKVDSPTGVIPRLGYLEAELALDADLALPSAEGEEQTD